MRTADQEGVRGEETGKNQPGKTIEQGHPLRDKGQESQGPEAEEEVRAGYGYVSSNN
jgi:hypothetical protein